MKKLHVILFLALLPVFFSCEHTTQECCLPFNEANNLIGKWQIYEYGYSPGNGYIIKEVPDDPAQIINFKPENQFSSNYPGFEFFTYYLILNDKLERKILALYEEKPDDVEDEHTKNLDHSYVVGNKEGNLKLSFRYCSEGCHIGLRKLD